MSNTQRTIIQHFFNTLSSDAFMSSYWSRKAFHEHGRAQRLPPISAPILQDFEGLTDARDAMAQFQRSFSELSEILKMLCKGELLMPLWFKPMPEG